MPKNESTDFEVMKSIFSKLGDYALESSDGSKHLLIGQIDIMFDTEGEIEGVCYHE